MWLTIVPSDIFIGSLHDTPVWVQFNSCTYDFQSSESQHYQCWPNHCLLYFYQLGPKATGWSLYHLTWHHHMTILIPLQVHCSLWCISFMMTELRRCAEVSTAALHHCSNSEDDDHQPPLIRSTLNYDYFSITWQLCLIVCREVNRYLIQAVVVFECSMCHIDPTLTPMKQVLKFALRDARSLPGIKFSEQLGRFMGWEAGKWTLWTLLRNGIFIYIWYYSPCQLTISRRTLDTHT